MKIHEVLLKNFKSFKDAKIRFGEGFNSIAGPNGSGKSNICDAIRFAVGETRLNHLRAKSSKDLIHHGSSSASVTLILKEGDKSIEIKRAIRKDGKLLLKVNGKKRKLSELKAILRKINLDNVDRAIINQGEIERIATMNPKELRKFIDELSGVGEYERKKQEAMKELSVVDSRIKEANILLGEKMRYLNELKEEKEKAEKYANLQKELNAVKYSLTKIITDDISKRLEKLETKKRELEESKSKLMDVLERIRAEIKSIYEDRATLSEEIEEKTKRDETFRRIEELKSGVAVKEEKVRALNEKRGEIQSLIEKLEKEIDELEKKIAEDEAEAKEIERKAKTITIEKIKKEDEKIAELNAKIEAEKDKLTQLNIDYTKISEKINALKEKISEKQELLSALEATSEKSKEDEIKSLQRDLKRIEKEIMDSFTIEKKLNEELANADKELMRIREKLAVLKTSVSPSRVNPAIQLIDELRKSGKVKGIFGRVIDLIEFDESLAEAVEAAGGGRLSYVVVDNIDTAKKVIEYLRKSKMGRATFIPLADVKVHSGGYDAKSIINFISYDPMYENAIRYVFGDTALVETFEEGKKYIGKRRAVALDGTLFESSGVVSGGKTTSSLTISKSIKALNEKMDEIKARKSSILERLKSLRDEVSNLRSEKARIKATIDAINKEKASSKSPKINPDDVRAELSQLEIELAKSNDKLIELANEIEKKKLEISKLEDKRKALLEKFKVELEESEKKSLEAASLKARLIEKVKQLVNERQRAIVDLKKKRDELSLLISKRQDIESEIRAIEDDLRLSKAELAQLEDEFKASSKKLNEIMEKMKKIEARLQELGAAESKATSNLSKIEKQISKLDVDVATEKTRLDTLFGEMNRYENAYFIDKPKHELEEHLKELESDIQSLGQINFMAKDLYYKVYDEVGEVTERVEKLKKEKDSIISLINEMEMRKKQAFLETFNLVNKNFENLIKEVKQFGNGQLYLDNPDDVMNSGLRIKIIRGEQSIPLESLSGGEKTLVSIMFLFAMQFVKPSPFYILDEVDAALDKLNSKRLGEFIKNLSKDSQFIVVSHNDIVISSADVIIGVTSRNGVSQAIGINASDYKKKSEGSK